MAPVEVFGDATRRDAWAAARLLVDGDRVVAADVEGLEREIAGLSLLEAARVGGEPLAVEALAAALGQVFRAAPDPTRVAVAMSGGVDSAVALLRALPNAIGVTLRLWQDPLGPAAERACCSPEAVASARVTCHRLGVPHVTLDLREPFRSAVVAPFVAAYVEGETPNPCVRCNGAFRFDALLDFAARAGAGALWTGHYARVVERGRQRLLARAVDASKDQSYMLAALDPRLLDRVGFPLGEQTKQETRAEAERAGLDASRSPESQEACFLAGGDYRAFLERQGAPGEAGPVVDEDGLVVGSHEGYWRYTIGQRRGLGVTAARPLHVIRTDAASNTVVVGPRESLAVTRVEAEGQLYADVARADVKLRYRSPAVAARVASANGGFVLELDEAAHAVARGQLAALYDGDAVVGAGVITRAA